MREIKFRAWYAPEKYLAYEDDPEYMMISNGGSFSLLDKNAGEFAAGDFVKDDDCVFMQYTGLKDKNGVEIYEGDIILTNHEIIRSSVGNWKPRPKVVKWVSTHYKVGYNIGNTNDGEAEVIGNIYENPELLYKAA